MSPLIAALLSPSHFCATCSVSECSFTWMWLLPPGAANPVCPPPHPAPCEGEWRKGGCPSCPVCFLFAISLDCVEAASRGQ